MHKGKDGLLPKNKPQVSQSNSFVLAWLSAFLYLANYIGVQRPFPLVRAKRLWLRAVGRCFRC